MQSLSDRQGDVFSDRIGKERWFGGTVRFPVFTLKRWPRNPRRCVYSGQSSINLLRQHMSYGESFAREGDPSLT